MFLKRFFFFSNIRKFGGFFLIKNKIIFSDAKKLKVAVDPEATVHINNLRIKNEKKQQLQEMVADVRKKKLICTFCTS